MCQSRSVMLGRFRDDFVYNSVLQFFRGGVVTACGRIGVFFGYTYAGIGKKNYLSCWDRTWQERVEDGTIGFVQGWCVPACRSY